MNSNSTFGSTTASISKILLLGSNVKICATKIV